MTVIKIEHLEWDSKFFGFPVGCLKLDREHFCSASIKKALCLSNFCACYVFGNKLINNDTKELTSLGAIPMPEKVIFNKRLKPVSIRPHNNNIIVKSSTGEDRAELTHLAYLSGIFSRFNRDPNFKPQFQKFYRHWMIASLERKIADEVFVAIKESKVAGMITCKVETHKASIGLLAVGEQFRGYGIATTLLNECEAHCRRAGATHCTVATQGDNLPACRLYEKNGYHIFSRESVFHYWKKTGESVNNID